MTKSQLLIALIAGIAFSLPASAKMYKWVDDQGVTHYGETIPPQYADKDRSELNKKGRVIKTNEVLSPEERLLKEEEDARKRAEKEAALESRRRDKALINTYSSPDEIDLARHRNLQQIDARVNGVGAQLKIVSDRMAGLQKEADGYRQAGKKLPPSLQDDLSETQGRVDKLQQDLEKAKADKAAMEARYDADKARYRELTGK
jgi:chromosome segregation ATPase